MATAQMNPETTAGPSARHGSTRTDHPDRRHPVRTALRGVGVFLDTTWRVVLLGSDGVDGARR
ncbi:hypothetical protein [Streptacidiphilus cavernicola]|uniref:Uncharacterized protein n=1 Tax=Streptacidiphilus cavernicola TaxID=3342716 RepID=A0ABV6VNM8_9ACTN